MKVVGTFQGARRHETLDQRSDRASRAEGDGGAQADEILGRGRDDENLGS